MSLIGIYVDLSIISKNIRGQHCKASHFLNLEPICKLFGSKVREISAKNENDKHGVK